MELGLRFSFGLQGADNLDCGRTSRPTSLDTCGEIAEEMGLSKGQVSKLAKKAEKAGWLKKVGRKYQVIANPRD